MRVKEQLVKANRLEEVICVLNNLVNTTDVDFPVSLFMDTDNTAKHRVLGTKVREQAKLLLEQIEADNVLSDTDFEHLYQLVDDRAEMNMHNYANDALHRVKSDVDLEITRVLVIISSMILTRDVCNDEDEPWDVPKGWAKID